MAEFPFICFCWSFPAAALQGNCIVLGTEALWRTGQGKLHLGSFENTLSKPKGHYIPGCQCQLDT